MLSQIVTKTPLFVWAILAFLVYRGLAMRRDRAAGMRALAILPLAMLGLSLQGVLGNFGMQAAPLAAWLLCMLAGAALSWRLVDGTAIATVPATVPATIPASIPATIPATESDAPDAAVNVIQRGSWTPLALMMTIFVSKYVVAVALSIKPTLAADSLFAGASCALFGLCSGLFLGRSGRYVLALRVAMRAVTSMPMPR